MLDYNPTSHGYRYYIIVISAGTEILKNLPENTKNSQVFKYFCTHTNNDYIIPIPMGSRIVA